MSRWPDISKLTEEQKDKLLLKCFDAIDRLEERVKKLEDQIAKDSNNSSKPPSSDNAPRTKSQRKPSGKKPGGQKGHKGQSLEMTSTPDHREIHEVNMCDNCEASLEQEIAHSHERRQVFDLPKLSIEVTEHLIEIKECPHCREDCMGQFPENVTAPVQYGKRIKALSVYLNQYQLLPLQRLSEFFEDVLDQRISEASLLTFKNELYDSLQSFENEIKERLIQSDIAHFDETGHRVKGKRQWLHSVGTQHLTFYASHKKRGAEAMEDIGILPLFEGRAMHDYWSSYYKFDCDHGLCNSHHFRDLTFLEERHHQTWAKSMKKLLTDIYEAVNTSKERGHQKLSSKNIKKFVRRYKNIVTRGFNRQPPVIKTGKRGKTKKGIVINFLERLRDRKNEVLAFMYDFNVPFTNNLAERDIRMVKVQQKISGTFRTQKGADIFCRIRGYISTCRKNAVNVMMAIENAFNNQAFLLRS